MRLSPINEVHVDELLDNTIGTGCRELRLRAGQPPQTRSCRENAGDSFLPYEAPSPLDIQQMVYAILTDEQIWQLEREKKLSFSYFMARRALFNVHIVVAKTGVEADFLAAQS